VKRLFPILCFLPVWVACAEQVVLDFTSDQGESNTNPYTYVGFDVFGDGSLLADITLTGSGGLNHIVQGWGDANAQLDGGNNLSVSFSNLSGSKAAYVSGFAFQGLVSVHESIGLYSLGTGETLDVNGVTLTGLPDGSGTEVTGMNHTDDVYQLEDQFTAGDEANLEVAPDGTFLIENVSGSIRFAGFQMDVELGGTIDFTDGGNADASGIFAVDEAFTRSVDIHGDGRITCDVTVAPIAGKGLNVIAQGWGIDTQLGGASEAITVSFGNWGGWGVDSVNGLTLMGLVSITDNSRAFALNNGETAQVNGVGVTGAAGGLPVVMGYYDEQSTAYELENLLDGDAPSVGAEGSFTIAVPAGTIRLAGIQLDIDYEPLVVLPPPAHYDDWIDRHELANALFRPSQDSDGDGASNVYEWATGTDPGDPTSRAPFHFDGSSVFFDRNLEATDLVYRLESSADLGLADEWQSLATHRNGMWDPLGVVAEEGDGNPVKASAPVEANGERGFYRLNVGWKNPNIVLIYADDLGFGDLGCYGATKIRTPNIDRLAEEGRMFTDAHSASAVCTASRYGMLIGEYPFRASGGGVWGPASTSSRLLVPVGKTTVGSMLQSEGYESACIGKWHLGFGNSGPDWNGDLKPGPLEVGFDYYFGVPKVNSGVPHVLVENHRVLGLEPDDPLVYGGQAENVLYYPLKTMTGMSGGEAAHLLYRDYDLGNQWAAKATQWIEDHQDHPFFLYLPTTHIHHPYTPDPRWIGTSDCGLYGDFVHELDWIVGEVLGKLDELGLAENTLVVVTSDNGGMLNDEGKNAWNAGHRINGDLFGFKFGVWEGGHRIPLIARWPGQIEAGSASDELMNSVDFLATFAAITGRGLKDGEGLDSFNMLPAFIGDPAEPIRDTMLCVPRHSNGVSYRKDNWVYIPRRGDAGFTGDVGGPGSIAWAGLTNSDIDGNGNYVADAPATQLYDLENDLSQTTNVVEEHADMAATMGSELSEMRSGAQTRP